MAKVKTSELTGPALDWAVAKCEGKNGVLHDDGITRCIVIAAPSGVYKGKYTPTVNWAQAGPIVEREKIDLFTEKQTYAESWCASVARYQNGMRLVGWRLHQYGPTPLIAAMRCFCCSKLGDVVDIPEELT